MFRSDSRQWLMFIIILSCFSLLFSSTKVLAEQSVYDAYTRDVNNGQVNDADNTELEGLPAEEERDFTGLSENKQSVLWLIVKVIFYLFIILIMIYGFIKFLAIRQNKLERHQLFKRIGGIPLGNNKSLQLVKIGQSYFLIGVGEQINLIKEITDPTDIALFEEEMEKQERLISKGFGSFMGFKEEPTENEASTSFQHLLKSSLEKQKQKRENIERKWNKSRDEEKEDTLA